MFFEIERIKRILTEINDFIYTQRINVTEIKIKACDYGAYHLLDEACDAWDNYHPGEKWGGKDLHCWFKTKIEMTSQFENKVIVFEVKTGTEGDWDALNPQFLVYVNNKPVQGLDVNHREVLLTEQAKAGDTYELALYGYSGVKDRKVEFDASISVLNREIEKLYYHIKVPLEVAELLEKEDKRRLDILSYITHAINLLDLRKPMNEAFFGSVNEVNRYLEDEFYEKYCGSEDILETCIGQTHIDVAWLWTLAQTREKVARSFSTVLNLMKQYPNYLFMSSQPQLYQYLKEDHPDIYAEVKNSVKEGRWEVEGAMWLEADCNLISGESLVRQIIYGKRFFKEEFGVDSKMLWLPDVFGYSAALPQILNKTGVKYFMTTKISWNEYNKMPYDTFLWRGIDGSEVFTHFITTRDYEVEAKNNTNTTYNGNTSPKQVMGCWQRYQQKALNNEVLNCFGFGDGGGGPTKEMLENVIRLEKGIPGAPKVKMGKALDYFERLDNKLRGNKKLPKWVGELYLEYHRGTYTSVARNKKYNRKTEFLNLDAELFSTMSKALDKNFTYPDTVLKACWETTLLNQFHDIIPGSSIKEVYEDSKRDYERINGFGKEMVNHALKNIAARIDLEKSSIVVFNQLGFVRSDVVTTQLPSGWKGVEVYDGKNIVPSQITAQGELVFFAEDIPSKGYKSFTIQQLNEQPQYNINVTSSENKLTNKFYEIDLDDKANISAIWDKANQRQVLKPGERANVLQAFEDKPHNFDAWDINIYYLEKMWEIDDVVHVKVIENGPVRSCLEIKRQFLDSTIVQKLTLYNDIPRIDFATWIDWKEKQILVKAAFPVDINASKATYEIQYGNVERPTHWNTSWDYARFEVCAHKWADISEGAYGVSLLNDCKYGHDIKDSVMRLTLLKSAVDPNVDADREIHEFNYALYPHAGDFKEGKVVPMAYSLNCPLYAVVEDAHKGELTSQLSLISVDCENVIIEVIKKAEDSEHMIVRVYECYNKRTMVRCSMFSELDEVSECDLLENNLQGIAVNGNVFEFEMKPYEIKTFKIKFRDKKIVKKGGWPCIL